MSRFTTVTVTLAVNADSAEAWTIIDEWVGTTAPHSVDSVSIHAESDKFMWIIVCTDEGSDGELFWSNDQGWTSIEDADVFTGDERERLNLPMAGAWLALP